MLQARRALQSYAAIETDTRVEQASPHRLIELLYEELLSCLRQAAIAIRAGNLPLKSHRISKALSILNGLDSSLDHARGGEVAVTLAGIYEGARVRIMAANSGNDAALLDETINTVGEIAQAWTQIRV